MKRLDKSELRHNIAARTDHDMNKHLREEEEASNEMQKRSKPECLNPAWKTPDHIRLGIAKKEIEERLRNRLHIGDVLERKKKVAVRREKNKFVAKFQERPFSLKAPDDWEELDDSDSDDTASLKSQYSDTANRANLGNLELPYYGQDYKHEKHDIDNTIHNRDTSKFEDLDPDYDGQVTYEEFLASKMRFKSHSELHSHLTTYKEHTILGEVAERYTHHADLGIPLPQPKMKTKTFNNEYFGTRYKFRSETSEEDEKRHDGGGRVEGVDEKRNFSFLHTVEHVIDFLTMQRARPKAAGVPLLVNRKLESLSKNPDVLAVVDFKPEQKVDVSEALNKQIMARQLKKNVKFSATLGRNGDDSLVNVYNNDGEDSDEEFNDGIPLEARVDDSKGFAEMFRKKIEDFKKANAPKVEPKKKNLPSINSFKKMGTHFQEVDAFEGTKLKLLKKHQMDRVKDGKVRNVVKNGRINRVVITDVTKEVQNKPSTDDGELANPNLKRPKSLFEMIFDEDSPEEDNGQDMMKIKSTPVSVGWRTSVIKHQMEIIKEASKPPPTVLSKLKEFVRLAASPFYTGPKKERKERRLVFRENEEEEEEASVVEEELSKKDHHSFKATVEKLINDKLDKAERVEPDFQKLHRYHSKYTIPDKMGLSLAEKLDLTHPTSSSHNPNSRPNTPTHTLSRPASGQALPVVDLSKSLRNIPSSLDLLVRGKSSHDISNDSLLLTSSNIAAMSSSYSPSLSNSNFESQQQQHYHIDHDMLSPRSDYSDESRISYISSATDMNRHLRSAASMGSMNGLSSNDLKGSLHRSSTLSNIKEDVDQSQGFSDSFYNKDISLSRTSVIKNIGLQTIKEVDASFAKTDDLDLSKIKSRHLKELKKDDEERHDSAKKLLYAKLHSRYEQDPHQLQLFQKEANDKMLKHKIEQEKTIEYYTEELDSWPKSLEYAPVNPKKDDSKDDGKKIAKKKSQVKFSDYP